MNLRTSGADPIGSLAPLMTRLNVADCAGARTHHYRRCACAPAEELYAIDQLAAGDARRSEGDILALHQVVCRVDFVNVNAFGLQLRAFLIRTWPNFALDSPA